MPKTLTHWTELIVLLLFVAVGTELEVFGPLVELFLAGLSGPTVLAEDAVLTTVVQVAQSLHPTLTGRTLQSFLTRLVWVFFWDAVVGD